MPSRHLDKLPWERLEAFRKNLHGMPECAGEEQKTAQAFTEWIQGCGAQHIHEGLGGHGVLACFDSGRPGPHWLFRAELDALPIAEGPCATERPYRSRIPGKAHLCGHDGHLSILAGLGSLLQEQPPRMGKVFLLAQPAEETGAGARDILEDPAWPFVPSGSQEHIKPDTASGEVLDACFAIHNLPGMPLGKVWCPKGHATAAVCSLAMTWEGHSAHAAEPEHGNNPAAALQLALAAAQQMEQRDAQQPHFFLAVPVHAQLGNGTIPTYGTAAASASLHLTFRAWDQAILEAGLQAFEAKAKKVALDMGLEMHAERKEAFAACRNNPEHAQSVQHAAESLQLSSIEKATAFRWGEDFGLFTQTHSGVLIGLGAGEDCSPLHHPNYDFPDQLSPVALALYAQLLEQAGI